MPSSGPPDGTPTSPPSTSERSRLTRQRTRVQLLSRVVSSAPSHSWTDTVSFATMREANSTRWGRATTGGSMGLRRIVGVGLAAAALVIGAAACSPMPTGGTTTTTVPGPWLLPGCLDGAGTDGNAAPDLFYNGTPNSRGNAVFFATISNGVFSLVGNGSCLGLPVGAVTIVRANNETDAGILCTSLNSGGGATEFTGSPWTAPGDAWACDETVNL